MSNLLTWQSLPSPLKIKNHSVTYYNNHLYSFGGYDGRRNHSTLWIYDCINQRWLDSSTLNSLNIIGPAPIGRNGHTGTLAGDRIIYIGGWLGSGPLAAADVHVLDVSAGPQTLRWLIPNINGVNPNARISHRNDHQLNQRHLYRNDNNTYNNSGNGQVDDDDSSLQEMNVNGLNINNLNLNQIAGIDDDVANVSTQTTTPPCNMHTADYIPHLNEIYVFRGGNGREYLNDLHALYIGEVWGWRVVRTSGEPPQRRANHSSTVFYPHSNRFQHRPAPQNDGNPLDSDAHSVHSDNDDCYLIIFGGWNGRSRLNDLHLLHIPTSTWSTPRFSSEVTTHPHPRAGMTCSVIGNRVYLFGGSGTSSKCFDDLSILQMEENDEWSWLDVVHKKEEIPSRTVGQNNRIISNQNYDAVTLNNNNAGTRNHGFEAETMFFSSDESPVEAEQRQQNYFSDEQQNNSSVNANPNDEDMVQSITIWGPGPTRRAGHTSTVVQDRYIYILGGSCGTDYLPSMYVLDTDPPPQISITKPSTSRLIQNKLSRSLNNEEFSDVTFIVEGQRIKAHRLILSLISEYFRSMFVLGFRESAEEEIEIGYCSYDGFLRVLQYIYAGNVEDFGQKFLRQQSLRDVREDTLNDTLSQAVELLELADQFFLDHLKQVMELQLSDMMNVDTYGLLLQASRKANATQLEEACLHFQRGHRREEIEY